MRILSHYFIARFLGLFVSVLAAALLLLTAIEIVAQLDVVAAVGPESSASPASRPPGTAASIPSAAASTNSALRIGQRLLADYLPDLMPLSAGLAAFLTFAFAGRNLERWAIEAGGVRLWRVVAPVLGAALILSLASGILHETWILDAERARRSASRDPVTPIDFGQKEFWLHQGRRITNIAQANLDARTLIDVEIFERSEAGPVERVIRGTRATIDADGAWTIESARIWRFDTTQPSGAPAIERVERLRFDPGTGSGDALLLAEPGFQPLPRLAAAIEADTEATPSRRRQLRSRYHERLSRPWSSFVFAWFAIPFGLRVDAKGSWVRPGLAWAGCMALFIALRGVALALAGQGLLAVGPASWGPTALMAAGGALLVWRQRL